MAEIKPRFEFRTFAQELGLVERKMRALSAVGKIRESSEIYIMSRGNNENNTKVRENLMDIKVFVQEKAGLEQWNPRMKASFPMKASTITNEVFPALGVKPPEFSRDAYSLDQYLAEIIAPHTELVAVTIFKRRFGFTVNECIAEIAEVYINGAKVKTANIESVDIAAIQEAKEMVSLTEYENINYLMAIKRVIGMEPGIIPM